MHDAVVAQVYLITYQGHIKATQCGFLFLVLQVTNK